MKWLTVVAAIAMAGSVMAQEAAKPAKRPGGRASSAMPGMFMPRQQLSDPLTRMLANPKFAERIGLSAEQLAGIKAIADEGRKSEKAARERLRAASRRQAELMKDEKTDEAALMAAIDEVFEARKEQAKAGARQSIRIKAVLTPEQLAKAKEEVSKFNRERMKRFDRSMKNRKPGKGPGEGKDENGDNPPPPPPPADGDK